MIIDLLLILFSFDLLREIGQDVIGFLWFNVFLRWVNLNIGVSHFIAATKLMRHDIIFEL